MNATQKIVSEFVGLRLKFYAYKIFVEEERNKKYKGTKELTLRRITFDDYKQTLLHHQTLF